MKETIKVLRPFLIDGTPTKVGQVIEVPSAFAVELRTAKKAEKFDPPAEAPEVKKSEAVKPQKGEK
jgi:hypothetical protein